MRCFIALEIDDKIINFCENKIASLKKAGFVAKWVESENFHLTLFFLGEIEENEVAMLKWILKGLPLQDFQITFNNIGCFKRSGVPSTLWLGISECDPLQKLYLELAGLIEQRVGRVVNKDFKPHLTLGRLKKYPENWLKILKIQKNFEQKQSVRVHLYSSTLTKRGPIYKQLI